MARLNLMVAGKGGLEGVVAGKTALSMVDGQNGRLTYRGYDIGDLAAHSSFEEVTFLLWYGHLPSKSEFQAFQARLAKERAIPSELVDFLRVMAKRSNSMEALRTAVSALSAFDPDANAKAANRDANLRIAHRLVAQTATLVAAYSRLRDGKEPIAPREDLSHSGNFLYMLDGVEPDAEKTRDFDVALILHADHGYNASTFSARVTASTLSDMHSAATAAVGTLKGGLHGGANEAVMRMLKEIGDESRAEAYIEEKLANRQKIPGFGHRIYKTLDPRAPFLKDMSERLGKRSGASEWYEMSTRIQAKVKELKNLDANVDFYSASTYTSMGIKTDLFTPIFALSRMAGWTAHILEQWEDNRLYRPEAEYTGPDKQDYVPLDKRA